MFERVVFEDWVGMAKASALIFFFLIFIYICYRVLKMPKGEVSKMSSLPLEGETRKDQDPS